MGKVTFTKIQEKVFSYFAKDNKIAKQFYLTGGTALSAFYFHHRESEDLDFFSETEFDGEYITQSVSKLSQLLKLPYRFTNRERTKIYEFVKNDKFLIKIDFAYHPYSRIEKGSSYQGITIDSLRDIATNKLLTINQRTDVKDFVDLYFLLKQFTIWDLLYGLKAKFRMEMDMILIAADFTKVEDFDYLPKMMKPLDIETLKSFFRQKAKEIGRKAVE